MARGSSYPMLEIHTDHIEENIRQLVRLAGASNIGISGVIKGFGGLPELADAFVRAGCTHIASSRIEQLARMKKRGLALPTMLIRIPRLCELSAVIDSADISLNSEWKTIEALNRRCLRKNRTHQVVLMVDLGDLREGYFDDEELMGIVDRIETTLSNIKLVGIGTNLGCYGSVKPSPENMGKLAQLAEQIEQRIGRTLGIVSGGATSSIPLLLSGNMPSKINNLRVGEGVLNNRDLPDLWNVPVPGLTQETFVLKAQIVEVKRKPTHPIGELFIDAYGNFPEFEDTGIRTRALLAVGKQDFGDHTKLIPLNEGVHVIGSSSDHLIVDVEDCPTPPEVGDILSFSMYYASMLYLSTSVYVKKKIVK